jgi:hypothetical protein
MEHGETIFLEASWALNVVEDVEAKVTLCGTAGGADMTRNLRITGEKFGQLFTTTVDTDAHIHRTRVTLESAADLEARLWIECIVNDSEPVVKPGEALVVAEIIDAIYQCTSLIEPACPRSDFADKRCRAASPVFLRYAARRTSRSLSTPSPPRRPSRSFGPPHPLLLERGAFHEISVRGGSVAELSHRNRRPRWPAELPRCHDFERRRFAERIGSDKSHTRDPQPCTCPSSGTHARSVTNRIASQLPL